MLNTKFKIHKKPNRSSFYTFFISSTSSLVISSFSTLYRARRTIKMKIIVSRHLLRTLLIYASLK